MTPTELNSSAIEVLVAARRIADYAKESGALCEQRTPRATCQHIGAVLADSVLQAGLNYATVVRPRVLNILNAYPNIDTVSALQKLIEAREASTFLNWRHHEKLTRFEMLVSFLQRRGIEYIQDLRTNLVLEEFCFDIQTVNGIGPKTVDYMACLVGIDSIAVDRHVRTFAKQVGVENDEYYFLRKSFCCAADFLALSRREFDAWLWRRAAIQSHPQLGLSF